MTAELYAADRGDGPQAWVFLHGFGGWHGMWAGVASQLPGRVVAYDLPGHGASLAFPGAGKARLAASAILADLAARGVEAMHLGGHSMGGAIAALMALAEPVHVRSLTLLAPGGFGDEINAPLLRRYAAAATAGEIEACLAEMSGAEADIQQAFIDRVQRVRAAPGQTEKLLEIVDIIARDGRQGVIPKDSLAALPMPVTVAWGTADPVLPYAQTAGMPAGFVLHSVRGAGHMLVEEAPDLVLDIIRRAGG